MFIILNEVCSQLLSDCSGKFIVVCKRGMYAFGELSIQVSKNYIVIRPMYS